MPKVKTKGTDVPDGWELVEETLQQFDAKMRDYEADSHEGKRVVESLWPIFRIHHQRSRYIYEMYHKKHEISRELYDFLCREKYADAALIAKWRKQGYEKLCCLRCIQTKDTNFGSTCICRVPRSGLEAGKIVECVHCGCRGCSSGDGGSKSYVLEVKATISEAAALGADDHSSRAAAGGPAQQGNRDAGGGAQLSASSYAAAAPPQYPPPSGALAMGRMGSNVASGPPPPISFFPPVPGFTWPGPPPGAFAPPPFPYMMMPPPGMMILPPPGMMMMPPPGMMMMPPPLLHPSSSAPMQPGSAPPASSDAAAEAAGEPEVPVAEAAAGRTPEATGEGEAGAAAASAGDA